MDFNIPQDLKDLAQRIRTFVENEVIPFERDERWTAHGPTEGLRHELVALAAKHALLAPHAPTEFGGLGLSHFGNAIAFEAAGYSMLGPIALHCAAPDEGNIHMLDVLCTPEQRQRWLRPLATGEVRSCFAMTEPWGAGSDPAQLQTTATPSKGGYVINGTKWLITGAQGAAFTIIMAKVSEGELAGKATMFLADMKQEGIVLERLLDSLDSSFSGGHWVMRFDNLFVPTANIIGEPGQGFRNAQVRLAPARLTHCMRWLGSAVRANDIARAYAAKRQAFGHRIGDHEGVGFMLADNDMDIHISRLAIWNAAWQLDQGSRGNVESSMCKVICSEAIWRVADRCVQILGGMGVTGDTVVERIFRDVRSFRIYDGPSEVHRWSLARRSLDAAK